MTDTDLAADRRFLRAAGRAAHAPSAAWTALILVNSAGAAAFALGLTLALTGHGAAAPILGLAGAMMVRAAAGWALTRSAARHARRVMRQVREQALRAVLARRRGAQASLGEAAAGVIDEVEALGGYFARFQPAALEARVAPIAIATAVVLASPIAAGLLLATLVPFAAIMALAGSAAAGEAGRQLEALARLSGRLIDRIRALPVVLAFEAEAAETADVAAAAQEVGARTLSVLRIAFISSAALEFFAALSVAMVAVYAGFSLLGLLPFKLPESLTFQRAFYTLALAPEFYAPMRKLAAAYHEKQLGEAAARRLRLQPAAPPLPEPEAVALSVPPAVRLEHVRLRPGGQTIGPISAEAPAGGLTVIVGPTGSGKTSVLTAILGLTPLDQGALSVGPWRLTAEGTRDGAGLARAAAWAGQAPAFLPASLMDNLRAAAPALDERATMAVAREVGLEPALARRREGAAMVLDERGSGLSGGERRRLALARALLKPSPLVLLDEPTADLDAAAEAEIVALLRRTAGSRTVIVATHSEALARVADKVVRLG